MPSMKMLAKLHGFINVRNASWVFMSRKGSVIVDFNLELVANVSDPLSPLKNAVAQSGGNLGGLVIDPSSIQAGLELQKLAILLALETLVLFKKLYSPDPAPFRGC
ncbi:hypothetical protein AC249_AIPGENE20914 [Exaiptasia diaphana]|nr:hypothetical protein AC249_AIPGENE20914 [Exaiptasia diaphana]